MELRIKDLCKQRGMTVTALAEKVGITQPNMSNIVNAKTSPSLELLERIARALGVDVAELFAPQQVGVFTCPHCGARLRVIDYE